MKRMTKARMLALAKAQRARGNDKAADDLEARAAKMSDGGSSKKSGGKKSSGKKSGGKKGGGRKAARKPAAKKAAAGGKSTGRKSGGKKSGKKGGRKAARKPAPTKNPSKTTKVSGFVLREGTGRSKRRTISNIGALKSKLKGKGRYVDVQTGKVYKAGELRRRGATENPSIGTGGIVAVAAGVVSGVGVGDVFYNLLVTRKNGFGETENKGAWYGRAAATRIEANNNGALAIVGATGAAVSVAGFAMLGSMPILGGFVFGLGLGHLGSVGRRLLLRAIAAVSPVKNGNERSLCNRVAPTYAEAVQKTLAAQIEYDNGHPQISEETKDGEVDLGSMDNLYTVEILPFSLTPNQLIQQTAESASTPGPVSGLGSIRERILKANNGHRRTVTAPPSELERLRSGVSDFVGSFGDEAGDLACGSGGCGSSCTCQSCRAKREAAAAGGGAPQVNPGLPMNDPQRPNENAPQLPAPTISSLNAPPGRNNVVNMRRNNRWNVAAPASPF